MPPENSKTSIPGTPFFVIQSDDIFVRDDGADAYQIESIAFVAGGVEGLLDVEFQQGLVHVRACFGSERWGESIGGPVVIDGVRYSVSLHADPVPIDDFDLAKVADSLSFSMYNLDRRVNRIGFDLPLPVEATAPVYGETRNRFVRSVSRSIRELAAAYPGFAKGFRRAVAIFEIGRLREAQASAWREMSDRTRAIHHYMKVVDDKLAQLAPLPFSSQETVPMPIRSERKDLTIRASGVHSLNVTLADGAAFVVTTLVDGSVHTEVMKP
ncbi:hypothetical protein HFN89_03730 [Rhizobium laguerreae]|nr:hypothetical protein [Rhizobium laguerreae]